MELILNVQPEAPAPVEHILSAFGFNEFQHGARGTRVVQGNCRQTRPGRPLRPVEQRKICGDEDYASGLERGLEQPRGTLVLSITSWEERLATRFKRA